MMVMALVNLHSYCSCVSELRVAQDGSLLLKLVDLD